MTINLILDCYILTMLYMNLKINTEPKPIKDTQQIFKNPNITLQKLINHKKREQKKKKNIKETTKQPETMKKMAMSIHLSVITLKDLKAPTQDIGWQNRLNKQK